MNWEFPPAIGGAGGNPASPPDGFFLFLLQRKKPPIAIAIPARAAPTPIPATAPVERPPSSSLFGSPVWSGLPVDVVWDWDDVREPPITLAEGPVVGDVVSSSVLVVLESGSRNVALNPRDWVVAKV